MIRHYLKFGLLPFAFFVVVMVIIHAQPYDERAPIAVLVPVTCRAPCLLGIRAGVTSIDDAITLLRKNEWVSQVIAIPNEIHPNQVEWSWSAKAPDYLQTGHTYFDGQILPTPDRKVSWMSMETSLTMGDIPLIMGDPQQDGLIVGGMVIAPDPKMTLIAEYWFPERHLWISSIQRCPFDHDFGELPAKVLITTDDIRTAFRTMPVEVVSHHQLMSALHTTSLRVCGF